MKSKKMCDETFYVGSYEISNRKISNKGYNFEGYIKTRVYEEDTFWVEENSDFYCNLHAVRIA